MTQRTLFDDLDGPPAMDFANPVAHAGDPATSHEAARVVTETGARARHARAVLALVTARPGSTALELMGSQTDGALDEYQIRRRLTDLKAAKLAEQGPARACRVKGTRMVTWYPFGAAPSPDPVPPRPTATVTHECRGHTLTVLVHPDGRRTFTCASMPDLAAKYDGAADAIEASAEFEQRAIAEGEAE